MTIAIVVVAHSRPRALDRLLKSVARASYDGFDEVPLVISIDGGGDPEVASVARRFSWSFGDKQVHRHRVRLGLKAHVLNAADRISDYDGIVMLEDDLMVSPMFYGYGTKALETFRNHETIAGVSLYSYGYLDVNGLFFFPSIANGSTFLLRFPSSWGQAWTTGQWDRFRRWLWARRGADCREVDSRLPAAVASWPASSWKKEFARYLVESGRYVVYPSRSLTTNMGDAGYHWHHDTSAFQVPLQFAVTRYELVAPSLAVSYDQFFELEGRSLALLGYAGDVPSDVEFDLYGQKPAKLLDGRLVISSKRSQAELHSYGMELLPHELNILYGVQGRAFRVGEGSDFDVEGPIPRTDLIKHRTASLGGRDLVKVLTRRLLGRIGVTT